MIEEPPPEAVEEIFDEYEDPVWRICHLYSIVDRHGKEIPFVPNKPQMKVLTDLYHRGHLRQVILKARQLGFSTLIEVILFDYAYWRRNTQGSIVADTADNAKKLLKSKVKFAYDKLEDHLKEGSMDIIANGSQMEWETGSSIHAGVRQRSGTNQIMHISEWGKIAAKDPERSTEIKTGALPTVSVDGIIFVESTFEGGRGGDFYKLIKRSMEIRDEDRTALDFHFQFFAWYEEPTYTLEGNVDQIPAPMREYLDNLTHWRTDKPLNLKDGQKLWYYKTDIDQDPHMKREHPSSPEEAFMVPVEGAIWGQQMERIRAKGQIKDFEVDKTYPIFTFWDLGFSDNTCIWWLQIIGQEVLWIDHYRGEGENAAHYAEVCRERPWSVHTHFLPHDAHKTGQGGGKTYLSYLQQADPEANYHPLQRTPDKWIGISSFTKLIPRMWFHKTRCGTDRKVSGVEDEQPSGVTCLENYRKKWQDKESIWSREPVHDWAADDADAARYFAEAWDAGVIPYKSSVQSDYQPKPIRRPSARAVSAFRKGSHRQRTKQRRR